MAKIYSMAVRSGRMTIEDVPDRWRQAAREEYEAMYGEEL